MKKEHGGKTYVQVPEKRASSCEGCVCEWGDSVCRALSKLNGNTTCSNKIWKEEMSEKKTALELVDGIINRWSGDALREQLTELKSAIELEQVASASIFARKETEILFHQKAIKELKLKLSDLEQSAITMRPITEELQHRDGDTTNILSNILRNWSEEKQKSLVRGIMGESLIEMRPISELPDQVPYRCVIMVVSSIKILDFFTLNVTGLRECVKDNRLFDDAIGFYILPLPLPTKERKLKPCPWCKVKPRPIDPLKDGYIKYYHLRHDEDCPIRDVTYISPKDADKWGWE